MGAQRAPGIIDDIMFEISTRLEVDLLVDWCRAEHKPGIFLSATVLAFDTLLEWRC